MHRGLRVCIEQTSIEESLKKVNLCILEVLDTMRRTDPAMDYLLKKPSKEPRNKPAAYAQHESYLQPCNEFLTNTSI